MIARKITEWVKRRGCNTILAAQWHRYAPSLTIRKRFYGSCVFMNLRDNIDDITKSQSDLEEREGAILKFPYQVTNGIIWDVGANVGLFSVRAAQLGRKCVAFELSRKACDLMNMTKRYNGLDFKVVPRPLTVLSHYYSPPDSASAENRVTPVEQGNYQTMSYREAAMLYNLPSFIKMDIEGGEMEFFNSWEFKAWLMEHSIIWLVEVHDDKLGFVPRWDEIPHSKIGMSHYLYGKDIGEINRLAASVEDKRSKK